MIDQANRPRRQFVIQGMLLACLAGTCAGQDKVDFDQQVAPVLQKYCAGCHNDTDESGDFSVSSLAAVLKGTPDGAVLTAGDPDKSKMLQMLLGKQEPKMPPEEEPQPTAADVKLIRDWIEQGAVGESKAMSLQARLTAPKLHAASADQQYVGAARAVGPQQVAIGRLGSVELKDLTTQETIWATTDLAGKINSLRVSNDGQLLIIGGGIAGIGGEVVVLQTSTGAIVRRLQGHADAVYCASLSPDGKWIASGSYDRTAILWDANTGARVSEFTGHNGAIYDLDFDPTSQVLATASGDQTVKLWNVASGVRLDTFGQPEGEMLCVRFSRDGQAVFAGSADRQIRKWRLLAHDKPSINPMLVARYAHESEVLQLQLLGDDKLVSCSRDLTIKLWDAAQLTPLGTIGQVRDVPVAASPQAEGGVVIVELTGKMQMLTADSLAASSRRPAAADLTATDAPKPATNSSATNSSATNSSQAEPQSINESEPNDTLARANAIELPAEIVGLIAPTSSAIREDIDLYTFTAKAGQPWIFEVKAARDQSKLDSRIDILDEQGRGIVRTRLQAMRESYLTFRGKDSSTSDDFRLHKWEDMELDEYLYSSGEVTRLWLYPRGPDSGFKVYPGAGSRNTFFDTTAVAHALGEPAYIVRELKAGEEPLPNGLPVFPIFFENDDDAARRFGLDSRLTFVAPADGKYFLRIRDSRGFGGPEYKYSLAVRVPRPDFSVAVGGPQLAIPLGSGREWSVTATRFDGLDEAISIELVGLPAGLTATNPLVIEAGQVTALGTIYATPEASALIAAADSQPAAADGQPKADAAPAAKVHSVALIATSRLDGVEIKHEIPQKLEVTVVAATGIGVQLVDARDPTQALEELSIHPGQTITARIVVDRNGLESRIGFGNEDSGRNLPHGAFVDNIGLNGLLIPEGQTEREFFIRASEKVAPGRRQFHLRSDTAGNPTSRPIWLNVISPSDQPSQ